MIIIIISITIIIVKITIIMGWANDHFNDLHFRNELEAKKST